MNRKNKENQEDPYVKVNVVEEVDEVIDSGRPSCMDSFREWFDERNNLLKITWKNALIYITLSYVVNAIFFWALDDDGRKEMARVTFCFGRLHAILPVQFFLGSLVFLAIGRWFQAYQTLLPGTNKLMRYYSTSLKAAKPDDAMWPDRRQHMIKKWNDWVLLSWLLTIRVISPPLRHQYPSLDKIKDAGLMTDVELQVLKEQQSKKKLKTSQLSLVVFEWLVLLNEKSASDYRMPADFKVNFDAIQFLKKSGSNLIKFSSKNIPKLMILAATLAVYIFGLTSILGHNVIEFEKDPVGAVSTSAIVGAFFYPLIYLTPYLLYCVWLRYLRSTTDPFGWDDDDIDVCEVFSRHVQNANCFCHNPGVEYSLVMEQHNDP